MGVVTLVGVEPKLLSPVLSTLATQGAWERIVEHAAPVPSGEQDSQNFIRDLGYRQQAIIRVLDATAFAPPPSIGVIIGIGACMLLLAAVVGPLEAPAIPPRRVGIAVMAAGHRLDRCVFRGRPHHATHSTRNGESSIGSVRVIDVLRARPALPSVGIRGDGRLRRKALADWSLPDIEGTGGTASLQPRATGEADFSLSEASCPQPGPTGGTRAPSRRTVS